MGQVHLISPPVLLSTLIAMKLIEPDPFLNIISKFPEMKHL